MADTPARDGETLSDEQTVTGGDPIMGALSMFGSYIRCGDSWDSCAQQAYDRAESAVAALRAEVAALRAKCDALDDALADETGRARQEQNDG